MLPHMLNFRQTLTSSILLGAIHFKSRIHICEQQGPFKVPNHYAANRDNMPTCLQVGAKLRRCRIHCWYANTVFSLSIFLLMALQKKKKRGKQKSSSHKEEACFSSTPNLKIQGKKYFKEKTKKKKKHHKNQPQNQQKKRKSK